MINQFASDSILYYPTIEFQSETWLKQALTFWDTVYRIVPQGYIPLDSEEIKIAKTHGFIKDIELSNADLKKAATEFENYYEKLDIIPSGYSSSDYQVRLHSSKMDDRLRLFFNQYSALDSRGFYSLPEKVANGYMFFLADSVSKNRNIGRLTDNEDMFAAMMHFDVEGNFEELFIDYEAEELYSTLIIENLVPHDIRSINIEIVLDLSTKLKTWKKEFRKNISDFNDKLSNIKDKSFAQKEIELFKAKYLESKQTRTEILKSITTDLLPSLLYVGIPASMTGMLGTLFNSTQQAFDYKQFTTGLVVGSVAAISVVGKDLRQTWSSKRANYYLEIKKHLTASETSTLKFKNMSRLLDQYIND